LKVYCTWKSYNRWISPYTVFRALKIEEGCFFLESALPNSYDGRYSFLGFEPCFSLKISRRGSLEELRRILDSYKLPPHPLFPFLGGAAGYFSYDLGFRFENIKEGGAVDDLHLPDCLVYFYNCLLIFDHIKKCITVFSCGFPEKSLTLQKSKAEEDLRRLCRLLNADSRRPVSDDSFESSLESNLTREEYFKCVNAAKHYISKGDIYQVNLSQRFKTRSNVPGEEIYHKLRQKNPANFSVYLDCGYFQIISSSPERFLKVRGRKVYTQPMKGTRPRGRNKKEDESFKKELLNSSKDKAELLMIVDLERNDLGRVCEYNSIKVNNLRRLEKYKTVFQTTAVISGILKKDVDRIDLLKATFPGGSITGCPKIRSMEIIDMLEPTRRSIYTGSLGYLSFSGDMDLNILIRTILKKGDNLYFQTGGGIVADSDPLKEYEETLVKAKGMMETIGAQSYTE